MKKKLLKIKKKKNGSGFFDNLKNIINYKIGKDKSILNLITNYKNKLDNLFTNIFQGEYRDKKILDQVKDNIWHSYQINKGNANFIANENYNKIIDFYGEAISLEHLINKFKEARSKSFKTKYKKQTMNKYTYLSSSDETHIAKSNLYNELSNL